MGMHNKATHSLAWAYSHSYSEALVVDPLPPCLVHPFWSVVLVVSFFFASVVVVLAPVCPLSVCVVFYAFLIPCS